MNIQKFVCNPFQENTYFVWDDAGNALLIDPGFYDEAEFSRAARAASERNLQVRAILNTHLHLDHCIGNGFACGHWKMAAQASEKDLFLIRNAARQAAMFGLDLEGPLPDPEKFLKEGDEIVCGKIRLEVFEVPGHSPGSLAFYFRDEGCVFAGDVLFRGSYGRTDLPGGDEATLMRSIQKLLALPADTAILCGHGPMTTVGQERPNFGLRENR